MQPYGSERGAGSRQSSRICRASSCTVDGLLTRRPCHSVHPHVLYLILVPPHSKHPPASEIRRSKVCGKPGATEPLSRSIQDIPELSITGEAVRRKPQCSVGAEEHLVKPGAHAGRNNPRCARIPAREHSIGDHRVRGRVVYGGADREVQSGDPVSGRQPARTIYLIDLEPIVRTHYYATVPGRPRCRPGERGEGESHNPRLVRWPCIRGSDPALETGHRMDGIDVAPQAGHDHDRQEASADSVTLTAGGPPRGSEPRRPCLRRGRGPCR